SHILGPWWKSTLIPRGNLLDCVYYDNAVQEIRFATVSFDGTDFTVGSETSISTDQALLDELRMFSFDGTLNILLYDNNPARYRRVQGQVGGNSFSLPLDFIENRASSI